MGYKSRHHDKRLIRGVFYLTAEQLKWIRKEAYKAKVSPSQFVRRLTDAVKEK